MTMDGDPLFRWRAAALARRFASDSSGAMAVDYAVVAFIAVAIAVAVGLMGDSLAAIYQRVREIFPD
jgi:Flp pilus assembly pilin Flp